MGTLVYGIISFLLIAAGTVVGDWIARWLSRRASPRLAQQIAVKIVGSESGGYGPSVGDDRVRRLAAVISALGPLLALVGSVVTAYFTYLAAITKVVTK